MNTDTIIGLSAYIIIGIIILIALRRGKVRAQGIARSKAHHPAGKGISR